MEIEPWQVPVLVMTLVILPPSVMWAVRELKRRSATSVPNRRPPAPPAEETEKEVTRGRFRTSVLAVLTVGLLGLFFVAIGTEGATLLTSAATAVSTSVSAALTVRSLLDLNKLRQDVAQLSPPPQASGDDRRAEDTEETKRP